MSSTTLSNEEMSPTEPKDQDETTIVQFDEGDKWNPKNFSKLKKWAILIAVTHGAVIVTCSSSLYVFSHLGSMTYCRRVVICRLSRSFMSVRLSLFLVSRRLSSDSLSDHVPSRPQRQNLTIVFLGPLSEFYGRKPVYIVSYFFFLSRLSLSRELRLIIVWQIPTALAQNIATIIVTRFLAGFSGAAFLSVSGGSITDMWIKEQVSWPMVIYTLGPFLGPTIGPLVGGFINQHVVWRWTFYVILIWSGAEVYS